MTLSYLNKNSELYPGDFLMSDNQQWKLHFQKDGNFVLYGWSPRWASDTDGQTDANRLSMQQDGNLVMYRKDNTPMWSTGTYESGKPVVQTCSLKLHDDGKFVILRDDQEVWSSTDSRGKKE